ncbi:MAG TPA: PASTA domain-containing protein [Saprospiraceae bacterium]|nr:PASTA domain-containing protein [Saprospiraceae bacterium]HMQ83776.1 PASTA domain-containing protein [Saprospiraceae bacterium]
MKIGIFFGGPSREREISFAGGRTVYDNLDKSLFEPIPIFVDSHRRFMLLDWQNIYKGTIRDFYPPISELPPSPNHFQIYLESLGDLSEDRAQQLARKVGRLLKPEELPLLIDVAFLALHGEYGEDGQIQQQLSALGIPYTGSGVRASQIGMDKALQKGLMAEKGFDCPKVLVLPRQSWLQSSAQSIYEQAIEEIGFPMVIRPANQGSSIGVKILEEEEGLEGFDLAINLAFFRQIIPVYEWKDREDYDRVEFIRFLSDIRDGIGLPLDVTFRGQRHTIYHPEELLAFLNDRATEADDSDAFILEAHSGEEKVIVESFIRGKEFSCIVIRLENGGAVALPPTEIVKGGEVFDYRSKYLPGLSRKITPIQLPDEDIQAIRKECERLFVELGFQVYARIDGFITPEKRIFLNDPNTTSGMMPSSFFFHQAAEIGLNPSQFLTYIIRVSLQERLAERPGNAAIMGLLQRLDQQIAQLKSVATDKQKIAVVLGGYSFERHISVESGRNVFEKLASSTKYEPFPVFLSGNAQQIRLFQLPINLLLKDNADDIQDKIAHWSLHPVVEQIKALCSNITEKYASPNVVFAPEELSFEALARKAQAVFIALHGRPGEDGQLQAELEKWGLPYNGSDVVSSAITINKYQTIQNLRKNGLLGADQLLLRKGDYQLDTEAFYNRVETRYSYPFVAKPVDDGCSSAVKIIKSRAELEAFVRLMFRPEGEEGLEARKQLHLKAKEEFPRKEEILFENLIQGKGAQRFMEITGGLLTHTEPDGSIRYEVFEPSEALSSGDVLSLEEKFLAGEGQNITPARFSDNKESYELISRKVKSDLEKAARILNVKGYARIDAFVRIYDDQHVETIIIEVNSLPGMTPATCIFHQAAINEYKPFEFIDRILSFAIQEKKKATARPVVSPQDSIPTPATSYIPAASTKTESWQPPVTADKPQGFQPQPMAAYLKDRAREVAAQVWGFVSSSLFLKNFGGMLVLIVGLLLLVQLFLRMYTRHGQSLQVPNYVGMDVDDAIKKARKQNFNIVVIDSFFTSTEMPNSIYQQDPKPLQRAKQGRTIYVSKYRITADSVLLPSLISVGYNYEQYAKKLQRADIMAMVKERVFDGTQEENTIKHFYFQGEKITEDDVRRGIKIPKGSTLEFVITERNTGMAFVPDLVCKRYDAATFLLSSANLAVGEVYGEAGNREQAYVYKQEPPYEPGKTLPMGTVIDLYLIDTKPDGCPDELNPDSLEEEDQ